MLICFEGIDGSGKTTQAEMLLESLNLYQEPTVYLREPGGTELGEYVRDYLKSNREMTPMAELFFFSAARAELVERRIKPILQEGMHVILDRYFISTFAYQGYGRGLDDNLIANITFAIAIGAMPDVVFYIDLDPEIAAKRIAEKTDRFNFDMEFQRRVREGYQKYIEAISIASLGIFCLITLDGTGSPEEIQSQVWRHILQLQKGVRHD